MKYQFNFETNDTLNVERIIRATFANSDRSKFSECIINGKNYPLHQDEMDSQALIQKISTQIPISLQKFNQKKIQLYDTSKLDAEVNKAQWLTDLTKLKWYGPFDSLEDSLMILSATDSGNFQGLLLNFYLNIHKIIDVHYLDKNSSKCGSYFEFENY